MRLGRTDECSHIPHDPFADSRGVEIPMRIHDAAQGRLAEQLAEWFLDEADRALALAIDMARDHEAAIAVGTAADSETSRAALEAANGDLAEAREVAAAITPVPGGVGPMTRALLMSNTLAAATSILRNAQGR